MELCTNLIKQSLSRLPEGEATTLLKKLEIPQNKTYFGNHYNILILSQK